MKSTESTRWGIHAGKTGNAGSLFLKKHCVALGWAKMGEVEANLKRAQGLRQAVLAREFQPAAA